MRILSLLLFTLFTTFVIAQKEPFTEEELKNFRSYEGNQVSFTYDDLTESYLFKTRDLKQGAPNITSTQMILKSYIKLTKKDGDYCFSDVFFGFSLLQRGQGTAYDSVEILIGFSSNIKRGDAIKYKFDLSPDANGNSSIYGDEIKEIITKSDEINRPITFNFYNGEKQLVSYMLSYANVKQRLGGIVSTQKNLAAKYMPCDAL